MLNKDVRRCGFNYGHIYIHDIVRLLWMEQWIVKPINTASDYELPPFVVRSIIAQRSAQTIIAESGFMYMDSQSTVDGVYVQWNGYC